MFKIGDKVDIIKPYVNGHVRLRGIEVLEVDMIDDSVKLNLKAYGGGTNWWYEDNRLEKVEDKMFTKDMLVAGKHVVETRIGERYIVLINSFAGNGSHMGSGVTGYSYDLTHNLKGNDVVKVFEFKYGFTVENLKTGTNLKLAWTRQEKTEAEIQLDELDKQIAELKEQANKVRQQIVN